MMDPEMMNAAGAENAPMAATPDGDSDGGQEDGDTGPLSKIELEGAEDGNVIATHHKAAPERVKAAYPEKYKPHRHALKKDEVEGHIKKHKGRLKA